MVNKARALRAIEFVQLLHLTGDFQGKPFVLQEWQREILWNVYGTVGGNGYRQYQFAYLELPKKNGKTELTAALALYHLVCDGPGGQIYCCAAEREQASLVYRAAKQMIEQDEDLQELLNVVDSKKEIHNCETHTYLKVLSAEAYSKHGVNPSVVIFDELHAQQKRDLWDFMTFGAGSARKEPLWWVITTAGDDPDRTSIGWEIHEYARRVRDGELVDPTWYVKIYGAPEEADIYDERLWYEINPSLGVSIDVEKIRQEALRARNSPPVEKLFRWERLNQWLSIKDTSLLSLTLWDQTVGPFTKADLVGKRCYAGIDLSTINDLTGIALLFPPQDGIELDYPTELYDENNQPVMEKRQGWYFVLEAWHPLENMKQRVAKDHVPYDRWAAEGWLSPTPGNVIDYTYIQARIVAINEQYNVVAFGNDPRGAEKLRQDLINEHDIELIEVPQNIASLSEPIKEVERLAKLGVLQHEKNPLGRWCWGNVTVYVDGNGNYKPLKNKPVEKIDPMAALFNAMHLALKLENAEEPYYGVASIG